METTIHDDLIPKVNPTFTVIKFDNEILLYSETGAKGAYLNETAFTVWQLCKGELTVGQIIGSLEQTYPEQEARIREDVETALQQLAENNIIEFHNVG